MAPENSTSNFIISSTYRGKITQTAWRILDQVYPSQSFEMGTLFAADSVMAGAWIMAQKGIKNPH